MEVPDLSTGRSGWAPTHPCCSCCTRRLSGSIDLLGGYRYLNNVISIYLMTQLEFHYSRNVALEHRKKMYQLYDGCHHYLIGIDVCRALIRMHGHQAVTQWVALQAKGSQVQWDSWPATGTTRKYYRVGLYMGLPPRIYGQTRGIYMLPLCTKGIID